MIVGLSSTNDLLARSHYLGPCRRGEFAWGDDHGRMMFSKPTSRRIPGNWLELVRWCLDGTANAGSRNFSNLTKFLRQTRPEITTIISYSDPSQGHTGALYRACNWLWAPTWHRLRPPPTGNGAWQEGKGQAVKDRWVYPLAPDAARVEILAVQDRSIMRRMPWAQYREPVWRRGRFDPVTGGGDWKRWNELDSQS